jgi:hypothetical protein
MPLDLSSVRAKLAHSAKHAQSIRNEVASWMDRNPYSVLQNVNADSTRYAIAIRVNEPPPLHEWSLIIADCLYSLRCCLDHLVYAIASHEALQKSPSHEGRLQFPITDDRANFDDAVICRKQLGTISDPVRTVIERYQPYNRPHSDLPPLLSILRDLSNRDKHKLLSLALQGVVGAEIGMDFSGANPPITKGDFEFIPASSGEIEDGTEIGAMAFKRPTPNRRFDKTIIHVVIAVRHRQRNPATPTSYEWTDFKPLLNFLSAEVRQIIYEVSAKVV